MPSDDLIRNADRNLLRFRLLILAGAVLWAILAFTSITKKSLTVDEPAHIGAGLSYLAHGDFRMNPEHPPLFKVLSVLPVWLLERPLMEVELQGGYLQPWFSGQQNEYGYYLVYLSGADHQRLMFLARIVPILFGLLGGWVVYLWAKELSGDRFGGAVAAFLLLFYPEYLGHSRFVTLDVPTAVACGWISWAGWLWWKRPTVKRMLFFAVAAAAGSQIKLPITIFTMVLLLTMAGLWIGGRRRFPFRRLLLLVLVTAVCGYLGAWAGAGFRFSALAPGMELHERVAYLPPPEGNSPVDFLLREIWDLKLLPEISIATIDHVRSFKSRPVFLNGVWRTEGWYAYFFITFLLKTPIPMLIATALSLVAGISFLSRGGKSMTRRWRLERGVFMLLPYLVLFALVVMSKANLGHRYILFLYIPLCAWIGTLTWKWLRSARWKRVPAVFFLATHLLIAFATWPHFATYFNLFAGGSAYRGSRYLLDSNADWGQDMPILAEAIDLLGYDGVNLAIFGFNRPEAYGNGEYTWILPGYPYQVFMPDASAPNPRWPTAISLNNTISVRHYYGNDFAGEPHLVLNSILIYLPEENRKHIND